MEIDRVILVDIGNTFAKIYKDGRVTKISSDTFDLQEKFYYINVKKSTQERLNKNPYAINLAKYISIKTDYQGMGIDRKILCSYIDDGVIVDAGSAITVDIMNKGFHDGGFILPGISFLYKCYEDISPVLKIDRDKKIDINNLPQNTKQAIEYGIFAPIIKVIKEVSKDKKIYFTGGDGLELSRFFENCKYDELMIFHAMKELIKSLQKDKNAYYSTPKRANSRRDFGNL